MILYLASPVFMMIAYSFNAKPLNNVDNPRQSAELVCCTLAWWKGILDIKELNTALDHLDRRGVAGSVLRDDLRDA